MGAAVSGMKLNREKEATLESSKSEEMGCDDVFTCTLFTGVLTGGLLTGVLTGGLLAESSSERLTGGLLADVLTGGLPSME